MEATSKLRTIMLPNGVSVTYMPIPEFDKPKLVKPDSSKVILLETDDHKITDYRRLRGSDLLTRSANYPTLAREELEGTWTPANDPTQLKP